MKIDKLFIGLDLSNYDIACINNAYYLLDHISTIESVVLFHNIKFDFIGALDEFTALSSEQLREKILKHIKKNYIPLFKEHSEKVIPTVTDDNNTINAIKNQLPYNTDSTLFIFGSKSQEDGTGDVPMKSVSLKMFNAPVLFCPQKTQFPFESLFAAIDLKTKGRDKKVIAWANNFRGYFPDLEVTGLYVNQTPLGYFPYIEQEDDEIAEELWQNCETKFKKLSENHQKHLKEWHFKLLKGKGVVQHIKTAIKKKKPDLLIMGRNSTFLRNSNVYGSTTRKLLLSKPKVPVLVI
ncbi:universal stress protein [Flagellimonas okinawensis]|uniref:Universal stress protein n=1 Tax=Flagellimonas okinawensis TaxID=3031324 RepID=A0ABT5XLB8_9FLAO|nr:universal stress protein [[Muricauda] okinawensis]MDF0706679.1 universal stress protein [[Muricauda] okinawensis]